MVLLALAGCARTEPTSSSAQPCVFDSECPEGMRCVNQECVAPGELDGGPDTLHLKRFGEPCELGPECESGDCLAGLRGHFCTIVCQKACPTGFACKQVADPSGKVASLGLCAVAQPTLCQPCSADADCGATGADRCLDLGGARACGRECSYEACPGGYTCGADKQCAPQAQTCQCAAQTVGLARGCEARNAIGSCAGAQVCQATGWGACSAPTPSAELCNGVDDDCNGLVDDGLDPRPCSRGAGPWTCSGTESCKGSAGWSCDARTPSAEVCDYVDDNCDGQVDEGFVDGQGRYVTAASCGGCGNDCLKLLPHAIAASCVIDGSGAPACRADACEPGYFPYAGGILCMRLPDTLCRACSVDEDCVAPGSRCLHLYGEAFCGRDCGAGSPYPGCSAGYHCEAAGGAQQCVPDARTCLCRAANAGAVRSCTVQTCSGFQRCATQGGGYAWSACDVASYNPEICDGIDNNCDGRIDEGFLNPVSGKYDTPQSCGFCNNDCSKYWSPTLQHTTGVCDAAPVMPVCRRGPCATEVQGGVTYEWVDVNGDPADGCECRRVQGNTTVDVPDQGPYPTPGQRYVDENCDGIDGVIGDALFVWAGAPAGGTGAIDRPYRTLGEALVQLPSSGKKYVLAAEGTYRENVLLFPGAQLFGGYSSDFRQRDAILHTSLIEGQTPAGLASSARAAAHAENIPAGPTTVLSGFTIQGYDAPAAPDDQPGAPSYAVYVKDSGAGLVLSDNLIVAGRGGKGGRGSTGIMGFGRQASVVLDGQLGASSGRRFGFCPAGLSYLGGSGGSNPRCAAASAPAGGSVTCPVFNWAASPVQGNQAPYLAPAGLNGLGGYDRSFDTLSGFTCNHVTESGFPSNIQTNDGEPGATGPDAANGFGGAGSPDRYGSIAGGMWVAAAAGAQSGGGGTDARGGGGGGAGGGTARYPGGSCFSYEYGATGGGGGAGGCGGGGGQPGQAGGGSIAVFVVFSAAPAPGQAPALRDNRIQRGFGGDGGNGGFGGAGGLGGRGGFGGKSTTWSGSTGGKGGDGGNGGNGGGGGGGAGGPSFGILAYNAGAATWDAQNAFVTDPAANTGGVGGAGGSSTGPQATGNPGSSGAFATSLSLSPCAGGCAAGTHCDTNGACMPN